MLCMALVLEMHHPLAGPGDAVGADWSAAAVESYWPVLRAASSFAEQETGASFTLAVSPSWMALASDPSGRAKILTELDRRVAESQAWQALRRFIVDRWDGDAVALVRQLAASGAVDVIPMTSSHAWLPSVAHDPVVARAQVRLAGADCARRLGMRPSGIWLPFLGYLPGLESTLAESGLRYFGVTADAFLRGTVLPPNQILGPIVTPPGVAVFGVSSTPTRQILNPDVAYGHDPRYRDPGEADRIAADHADHFLRSWRTFALGGLGNQAWNSALVSVAALAAHDLGQAWPPCLGGEWLEQVLKRMATFEGALTIALGHYLDRYPTGTVGRPGPSAGGFLAGRPGGSDLFDRCRAATDLLTFALEHRRGFNPLERRTVAHMTRSLLRAQQVDWSLPPGHGIDAETGLERARTHLKQFYELAGLLLAGRPDQRRLDRLDRGPAYLPEIDLELLVGG
jgi:1,4-alpha-glucan branching enzyme